MGTFGASAFKDKGRKDSGKRDIYFNAPGDGSKHGHVVQSPGRNGNTRYHYVRDVEGNVYKDDRRGRKR